MQYCNDFFKTLINGFKSYFATKKDLYKKQDKLIAGNNITIKDNIISTVGAGLPEVKGSGKALVGVNGEWKIQDGYGYAAQDIIFESTITSTDVGDFLSIASIESFDVKTGEEYTVIYDDIIYENIVAQEFDDVGAVLTDDPTFGENFHFAILPAFNMMYTLMEGTFSVKVISNKYQEISENYLPDSKVRSIPLYSDFELTTPYTDGAVTLFTLGDKRLYVSSKYYLQKGTRFYCKYKDLPNFVKKARENYELFYAPFNNFGFVNLLYGYDINIGFSIALVLPADPNDCATLWFHTNNDDGLVPSMYGEILRPHVLYS